VPNYRWQNSIGGERLPHVQRGIMLWCERPSPILSSHGFVARYILHSYFLLSAIFIMTVGFIFLIFGSDINNQKGYTFSFDGDMNLL
jgi:hypothetical protein